MIDIILTTEDGFSKNLAHISKGVAKDWLEGFESGRNFAANLVAGLSSAEYFKEGFKQGQLLGTSPKSEGFESGFSSPMGKVTVVKS
jgi:hypothetical protein